MDKNYEELEARFRAWQKELEHRLEEHMDKYFINLDAEKNKLLITNSCLYCSGIDGEHQSFCHLYKQ